MDLTIAILLLLLLVIAVFILIRALVWWYFGIDRIIENQEKQIAILSEMLKLEQQKAIEPGSRVELTP